MFLPKTLGRALGVYGQGELLTNRALGENLGFETQSLDITNMPPHAHRMFVDSGGQNDATTISAAPDRSPNYRSDGGNSQHNYAMIAESPAGPTVGLTSEAGGDGDPTPAGFNVMQPESFMNALIKL
jgi:microcystin-dependent protein